MMQQLFTSYIQDLLYFLKQEKGFFQQEESKRKESVRKYFGFSSATEYLSKATEASFVDDLKDALKLLKENPDVEKKHLAESFARYFLDEFPKAFDQLNASFYRSSEAHQKSKLSELFPGNTTFFHQLRDILGVNSLQETSEDIVAFLKELYASPRIIVQSPLECDEKTKAEVRAHFQPLNPKSFVVFHVNSQLIGGIRFFVDGKVNDHSWFSKVQAIQQLSVKL